MALFFLNKWKIKIFFEVWIWLRWVLMRGLLIRFYENDYLILLSSSIIRHHWCFFMLFVLEVCILLITFTFDKIIFSYQTALILIDSRMWLYLNMWFQLQKTNISSKCGFHLKSPSSYQLSIRILIFCVSKFSYASKSIIFTLHMWISHQWWYLKKWYHLNCGFHFII